MTRATFAKIAEQIHKVLGVPADKVISEDSHVEDDLRADEMDRFQLQAAIEGAFDITLADDLFDRCRTVGELVGLVDRALAVKSGRAA